MSLAPIVVFVYNRLWHTKQTLEALQKNELASESELYIYCDNSKNAEGRKSVDEVRNYVDSIVGFKKVTIIKREKNWGLSNSIIDGVTSIVNKYGKIVVFEDDLVTSPYFLKFMNNALTVYENRQDIFSISGYTYPFSIPENYASNTFIFYRSSSWGWAIWKDRWNRIDFDVADYDKTLHSRKLQEKFNRGGADLFNMLRKQMNGEVNSWAIRFAFSHSTNDAFGLFPSKSLVQNIGHDNSGTHCEKTSIWNVELDDKFYPEDLELDVSLNHEIVSRLQNKFKQPLLKNINSRKWKRMLKKLFQFLNRQ
jgi:hypothetical protein